MSKDTKKQRPPWETYEEGHDSAVVTTFKRGSAIVEGAFGKKYIRKGGKCRHEYTEL